MGQSLGHVAVTWNSRYHHFFCCSTLFKELSLPRDISFPILAQIYPFQFKPSYDQPIIKTVISSNIEGVKTGPRGLAALSNGILVLAGEKCLLWVDPRPKLKGLWLGKANLELEIIRKIEHPDLRVPNGIAIDRNDNIIVSDAGRCALFRFDSSGILINKYLDNNLVYPWGLAITNEGNIAVADTGHNSVKIFSPDFKPISFFLCGGKPCGIAISSRNEFFVADGGTQLVHVYSSKGKLLREFGSHSSGVFQFLAMDCDDNVGITDFSCFKLYDRNGNLKYSNTDPELKGSRGICLLRNSEVVITSPQSLYLLG